ncbi:signal transduction histidine kinase [Clostridium tetanomorphum]|uniref:histidine kinase n=1 Tax=Clostridium tetanomorphum TaxID=1553 RepID=A0A923E7S0_CLOTT|nr:HAMP domain-containing sensor histidine kinase [Clostridium tetanomorphum]KAJ53914.1 two-component sensor histidine kinase [Clostridium tetanomorphum DSM 665]MBC2398102.1 HAMP domain-containing histidine kinase [Clostridium tetanomorphum]MBP1864671.1 signal transduction histidine kinase [Clostridium tetanomorphum]NRS84141.1 signal transduction histidine kinase [Clostridium tetanomorphum]NRZ97354.1 signal transduction histidine kinase [Clostridium tetanomorphum]
MNNNKKISNLLLRNYVISGLIMFLVFVVFFFGTVAMWVTLYLPINTLISAENSKLVAENIVKDDYKEIDVEEILKVKGWVEIVNKDYKIIHTRGIPKVNRNKYTKEEFYRMIINSNNEIFSSEEYIYNVAYNARKDFTLIVYLPNDNYFNDFIRKPKIGVRTFFRISVVSYLVIFILIMIIYTKITSRNLTIPLKKLMMGVKSISKGDYSVRIDLKSKNEFGQLRDAFNFMAKKIEEERTLKEKSEEARRRLIMDISHDLKNPLASIRGYSDLLIKNKELHEDEKDKYLSIIENNSIRVNDLITDLFELSKFESLDFNLELKRIDICEFVREVIAIYIPAMEEKNIEYRFSIPDRSINVLIDCKSMYRAISNLIINSIKYNPNKTKLKISIEDLKENILLIVEDDGIGIPKNLKQDIFNPFVRVDTSRNSRSGGTGLGLAITKTIIEKHEGKIELESDTNKGCKFIITLRR